MMPYTFYNHIFRYFILRHFRDIQYLFSTTARHHFGQYKNVRGPENL